MSDTESKLPKGIDLIPLRKKAGRYGKKPEPMISVQEAQVLQSAVIEGKPIVTAVKEAGFNFNPRNAKAFGNNLIAKCTDVNGELTISLANVGIKAETVAAKLAELMNAQKQIIKKKKKIKTEGYEEETIEYMDVPDYLIQHKGAETILDILPGARAPKKSEVTVQTFEQKATIVADLRDNPKVALEIAQRLLEQKQTVTETG
jgi:hypothetical protein